MDNLLVGLNEKQAEAVSCTQGPLLVLAGAGAGKTRVITYRIAYLINVLNVPPWNIMAVTFTNKAAAEMKARIGALAGTRAKKSWLGTFHSIGLNILRRFSDRAGIASGFGVVDQEDRIKIIKNVVKELNIDPKKFSAKNYLTLISNYKNSMEFVEGRAPEELTHRFIEVFETYQGHLKSQHIIDFDDMLSLTLRLFVEHPDVLAYYQERCKYILVDEYQDTNTIQFHFLQMLAGRGGNICVVGDDDQSIYGWRGADTENILFFDRHFDGVKEIKLTENYRSAPEILNLANLIIRNNQARRGKDLVAKTERKGEIRILKTMDEVAEAEHVASIIDEHLTQGVPEGEIAILYRTNAQSRNFEVVLNRRKIRYKVVGGVGFYQRREIKDVLSYLRVFDNPYDEASFSRAVKTPPKGIGNSLYDRVVAFAKENGTDYISATDALLAVVTQKQAAALGEFLNIIHHLVNLKTISSMLSFVVEITGYNEYLTRTEDEAEAKARMSNVEELYNSALSFEEQFPEGTLSDFLATATLVTSSDDNAGDCVSLMSLHSAKGLEFESVFLTGLEDGIFPLMNQEEIEDIEEERRLCYVGITRAKVHLTITGATSRLLHGKRQFMRPPRFLKELELYKTAKADQRQSDATFCPADGSLRKGDSVEHELFGAGIVLQIAGGGDSAKVDVMFKKHGIKKLVARFLKKI